MNWCLNSCPTTHNFSIRLYSIRLRIVCSGFGKRRQEYQKMENI